MLKTTEREVLDEIRLAHEPDMRIGEALLRPASRALDVNGESRALEPRVAQLLVALARRDGSVLGREDLVDLCWGGRIVGEDAINRCVAKARKATAGAGFEIETVPRVGYKLVAPPAAGLGKRRKWFAAAAVGALLLGLLLVFLWARESAPVRADYPPIAVGNFTTASDERAVRAATAEIAPQVLDALVKTGFPTIRRGTADPSQARFFIRGQVNARSDAVHVLIQMDDTRTRATVISQELDLDRDEIPLVADKTAAAAADAVTRSGAYYALTSRSADPAETAAFMNIVLQIAAGNYLEAELQAKNLYASRPDSRLAPFALSYATMYALPLHPLRERPAALAGARSAAKVARERLPGFGDVYIAQCNLYLFDYLACDKSAREGLAIDPSAPTLRSQLALLLMDAGHLREAHPLVIKALADTPFNPSKVVHNLYIDHLLGLGTEEKYVWAYAQRYWPRVRFAGQRFASLMAAGRWEEAEAMLPLVLRMRPDAEESLRPIFRALHSRASADTDRAQAACVEPDARTEVACFSGLSMLGRPKAAIEVARRFYPPLVADTPEEREALYLRNIAAPRPLFMIWGDGAKAMRQDPRFADFVATMGLVRYWKAHGPPDACRKESAPFCKLI